jgi:hypothetical protein
MEDNLKKNGRRPQKNEKIEDNLQKIKWKTNQSTKINLIGCDTIVVFQLWLTDNCHPPVFPFPANLSNVKNAKML